MTRKNRIMIYGSKDDGTYAVEFRMAKGVVPSVPVNSWQRRSTTSRSISCRR
jgi:hypothetical protein